MFLALSLISVASLLLGGLTFMSQRNAWEDFLHAWNEQERVDGDYAPKHRETFRYHHRRFRRRTTVSLLIAGVGVLLPVAYHFMRTWPAMSVYLWLVIIFLLVWIMVLGIMDAVSTYFYYLRVRDDLIVHRTVLEAKRKMLEDRDQGSEERDQRSGVGDQKDL